MRTNPTPKPQSGYLKLNLKSISLQPGTIRVRIPIRIPVVLSYLILNPGSRPAEISAKLGIPTPTVKRYLKFLSELNLIQARGANGSCDLCCIQCRCPYRRYAPNGFPQARSACIHHGASRAHPGWRINAGFLGVRALLQDGRLELDLQQDPRILISRFLEDPRDLSRYYRSWLEISADKLRLCLIQQYRKPKLIPLWIRSQDGIHIFNGYQLISYSGTKIRIDPDTISIAIGLQLYFGLLNQYRAIRSGWLGWGVPP